MNLSQRMLADTAAEFRAAIVGHVRDSLDVDLTIVRPSGALHEFKLQVRFPGSKPVPVVCEREPRQLPAVCVERHINADGSFCLNWDPGDPGHVTDLRTARLFWSWLSQFLELQLTAQSIRRWPGARYARAHGDAAAPQAIAEHIARAFGSQAHGDLFEGVFRTRESGKGATATLDLYRAEILVARVHRVSGFLINPEAICLCDSGRAARTPISRCTDHRYQIPRLANAIQQWHQKDAAMVRCIRDAGIPCCDTLDYCELRNLPPRQQNRRHRQLSRVH